MQMRSNFTLTLIFPPLYSFSLSGSSAGRRENSNPSISCQSSPCPSIVTSPGTNSAVTRDSGSGSQLHSPDSSWEWTNGVRVDPKKKAKARRKKWRGCIEKRRRWGGKEELFGNWGVEEEIGVVMEKPPWETSCDTKEDRFLGSFIWGSWFVSILDNYNNPPVSFVYYYSIFIFWNNAMIVPVVF